MKNNARLALACAAALIAVAASCTDDEVPAEPGADAGPVLTSCGSDNDCAAVVNSVCKGGVCTTPTPCSSDLDCPDSKCHMLSGTCYPAGTGTPTDGGVPDGGDGGGPNPTTCATKYDCQDGQICKGTPKACTSPSPDNRCNLDADCPRGKICNFSKQCEAGCTDTENREQSKDCEAGKLCHPQKFICEVCGLSNPCAAGKSCMGGACDTAIACAATQQCATAKNGTVCLNGYCGNCSTHSDCLVDPYKNEKRVCGQDGLCKKVDASECTDAKCKQVLGDDKAFCDTAQNPPACSAYQCLSDADCSGATPVCDTAQHVCTDGASGCVDQAAFDACNQQCQLQMSQCNPATCTCGGGGGTGTGAEGDMCMMPTDCSTGLTCGMGICTAVAQKPDGSGPCTVVDCALGGLMGTSCVSATDPTYQCDATGCTMSALMGLMGAGGGLSDPAPCL